MYFAAVYITLKLSPGVSKRKSEVGDLEDGQTHEEQLKIIEARRKARALNRNEKVIFLLSAVGGLAIAGYSYCSCNSRITPAIFSMLAANCVLAYAAESDFTSRTVENFATVMLIMAGTAAKMQEMQSTQAAAIDAVFGLCLAVFVYILFLIISIKSDGIGGADAKLSAATVCAFGSPGLAGVAGIAAGLLYGAIACKVKKEKSMPLIPYILGGVVTAEAGMLILSIIAK